MIKRVFHALKGQKSGFAKIFRIKTAINAIIIYCVTLVMLLAYNYSQNDSFQFSNTSENHSVVLEPTSSRNHNLIVTEYFGMRKFWKTSNLGSLLFKNENKTFLQKNKTFVIFVWKYWRLFQARHARKSKRQKGILSDCSVDNCVFNGENNSLETADVVLIHIKHGLLPEVDKRNPKQIWVFLNDESPRYTYGRIKNPPKVKTWENVFNWSMTYRSNADVPVPYGRTVPFRKPLLNKITYEAIAELIPKLQIKRTDVLVAILITTCDAPIRTEVLNELQKHIKVDVYGRCSKEYNHNCPIHFKADDCPWLDQYYFYLVIEKSMCRQYLTENIFFNAYTKGAIPIVVGSSLQDCETLLPPNSYIYYDDNHSYKELAAKITNLIHNFREYLSYHFWRNHFKIINEHGFYGTKSYHLCRLCEALNYNEQKEKILDLQDLRLFLDPKMMCMQHEEHKLELI